MSYQKDVPKGYMKDSKGRHCPINMIKDYDLLQDQMVRKVIGYAEELSAQIQRFKSHTFDDFNTYIDLLSEKYGLQKGGARGNATFTSFDQCFKCVVQVQDQISFGPELQIAKGLIDECLEEWSQGSRDEYRAIVNMAFNVDKTGTVNREAIFNLRKINIEHAKWKQAMNAINDSIQTVGSKSYNRFYKRKNPNDKWVTITINIAAD